MPHLRVVLPQAHGERELELEVGQVGARWGAWRIRPRGVQPGEARRGRAHRAVVPSQPVRIAPPGAGASVREVALGSETTWRQTIGPRSPRCSASTCCRQLPSSIRVRSRPARSTTRSIELHRRRRTGTGAPRRGSRRPSATNTLPSKTSRVASQPSKRRVQVHHVVFPRQLIWRTMSRRIWCLPRVNQLAEGLAMMWAPPRAY